MGYWAAVKRTPQQIFLAIVLHILFRTSLYCNLIALIECLTILYYVHVHLKPSPAVADKKSFEAQIILPIGNMAMVADAYNLSVMYYK